MNIPRLRRGRKRHRSDQRQSSGSSASVTWAERFASEELHHHVNGGAGSGSDEKQQQEQQQQQQQQQTRRASTSVMSDSWRFEYGVNPPDGSEEDMELASSVYLNSLMGRRESLSVPCPSHLGPGHGHGQGQWQWQGQKGAGMPNILDPILRTASPLMFPAYPPSRPEYEEARRSITPLEISRENWGNQSSTVCLPQLY